MYYCRLSGGALVGIRRANFGVQWELWLEDYERQVYARAQP